MIHTTHELPIGAIDDTALSPATCSRRTLLSRSGLGAAALTLACLPLGLVTIARKTLAQSGAGTTAEATTALTLVLKLELLQRQFYTEALTSDTLTALLTPDEIAAVTEILTHETAHVALLSAMVSASAPSGGYDFTAGSGTYTGPYSPFTNKADFLTVALYLEDLSVRTYLGALNGLSGDPRLTTLFRIQSIEGRHAAQIRRLAFGIATDPYMPTAWDSTPGTLDNAVYGPETTAFDMEGNPSISTGEDSQFAFSSYAPLGVITYTPDAFDEPLSMANVLTAMAFFGVS